MSVDSGKSATSDALVLIVEDSPDIRLMLEITLRQAGFETYSTADGEAALRAIPQVCPDLVLLDLMMPVLDGWGVLERLKAWPDAPPVIVVSGSHPPEKLAAQTSAMGAVGYMTKPLNPTELVDRIREALGWSRPA